MRRTAHIESAKLCAFCQYWYDPTNSAIAPKTGGFWEYEAKAKNRCLKKLNTEMLATSCCMEYKCKL